MRIISILLVLVLGACASIENREPVIKTPATLSELLEISHRQLQASTPETALQTLLDAQQQCMNKHNANDSKVFIHRTSDERFFYLLQASFEQVATSVETGPCAEISYLLGYTYFELDDIDNAQKHIEQAVEYSPVNPAYLSELGHIYQTKGDFQQALQFYTQAESHASTFSPSHLKNQELAIAKRGIGYNLIELGKLDEAEAKFNEALQLNPQDKKAKDELSYIAQRRIDG